MELVKKKKREQQLLINTFHHVERRLRFTVGALQHIHARFKSSNDGDSTARHYYRNNNITWFIWSQRSAPYGPVYKYVWKNTTGWIAKFWWDTFKNWQLLGYRLEHRCWVSGGFYHHWDLQSPSAGFIFALFYLFMPHNHNLHSPHFFSFTLSPD